MTLRRGWRVAFMAAIVLLMLALGLWRISKAPCWQLVGDVVCRIETDRKIVALSFDDGPTPEGTDAVLAALKQRRVKATFFLIGKWMERFPQATRSLAAEGHELGNHSYSHGRMIGRRQAHYREEIARTDALLDRAGAPRSMLFRPPFGKRLVGLPLAVEAEGYRTITWDVEDDRARYPDPESMARDIVGRVRPGSIILMHPMYRHAAAERAAIPLVIDGLRAKGYEIVPVGELLARQDP